MRGGRPCRRPSVGALVLHADPDGFRPDHFKGLAAHVCADCRMTVTHPHGGLMTFVPNDWGHVSNGPARKEFEEVMQKSVDKAV
jgi:hypothetical protein